MACHQGTAERGFGRKELIVIVAIVALLISLGMFVAERMRISAKVAACKNNLKRIGTAAQVYSGQSEDQIPYAGIRPSPGKHWSWDDLLSSLLGVKMDPSELALAEPPVDNPVLRCPSDLVPIDAKMGSKGGHRRSFAMPEHDMEDANWPPGPDNQTGLGLYWGDKMQRPLPAPKSKSKSKTRAVPKEQADESPDPANIVSLTRAMIPEPAGTIFLTERINPKNGIGSITASSIKDATRHFENPGVNLKTHHQGKVNYLFVDNHAEWLAPGKTLGPTNTWPGTASGMWTIKAGD